jgi:hypothetical protein
MSIIPHINLIWYFFRKSFASAFINNVININKLLFNKNNGNLILKIYVIITIVNIVVISLKFLNTIFKLENNHYVSQESLESSFLKNGIKSLFSIFNQDNDERLDYNKYAIPQPK